MKYSLIYTGKFFKALSKIHPKDQQRISIAVTFLEDDPFIGKRLTGNYAGHHSLRVWPYRVIYRISKPGRAIYLINALHRKDAYR